MNNKCDRKLLETVAFSNGCICFMELIQWKRTHFHPSGDVSPSFENLKISREVFEAGELLNIPLLEFMLVADSFKEHNTLND